MPLHIRDEETTRLVRDLAAATGRTLTDAVKMAARNELARRNAEPSRFERLRAITEEIASLPRTGLKADKAFYDSLNDE